MTQIAPHAYEPVCKAKRGRLSQSARAALWTAHDGLCAACKCPVGLHEFQADHIISLVGGGDNLMRNWQPLCAPCHLEKTRLDVAIGAKIKRIVARIEGTRRPRKPIPSPLKPWPKGKTRWGKRGVG